MRLGFSASLLAVLMIAAPVVLSQTKSLPVAKVVAEQMQLRAEIEQGSGRAARISAAKRTDLLARQKELLDMLAGKTTAKELSDAQLAFAHDTLALIDAAVVDDNEDRLVCRREKTIGSNMVTRKCRTVAQMRIDQERARETMAKGMGE